MFLSIQALYMVRRFVWGPKSSDFFSVGEGVLSSTKTLNSFPKVDPLVLSKKLVDWQLLPNNLGESDYSVADREDSNPHVVSFARASNGGSMSGFNSTSTLCSRVLFLP
jgi:hypothetical protein